MDFAKDVKLSVRSASFLSVGDTLTPLQHRHLLRHVHRLPTESLNAVLDIA